MLSAMISAVELVCSFHLQYQFSILVSLIRYLLRIIVS